MLVRAYRLSSKHSIRDVLPSTQTQNNVKNPLSPPISLFPLTKMDQRKLATYTSQPHNDAQSLITPDSPGFYSATKIAKNMKKAVESGGRNTPTGITATVFGCTG